MRASFPPRRLTISMLGLTRRAERTRALSLLLDEDSLPGGGWSLRLELTWLMGVGGKTKASRELRRAGKIAAMRKFGQTASGLWFNTTVIPARTSTDAENRLPHLMKMIIPNPGRKIDVIEEKQILSVGFDVENQFWFYDQTIKGINGLSSIKYVAEAIGTVTHIVTAGDRSVIVPGAKSSPSGWPWRDVIDLASLQSRIVQANALAQ